MKKLYYSAFGYLIISLITGLAFREITKFSEVYNTTALGKVHGHIFSIGFIMFLIFLLLEKAFNISESKRFNTFYYTYHAGVIISFTTMLIRGIVTILEYKETLTLSNGLDAAIAGMSGIGHIILTIALVIFMFILKNRLFVSGEK